MAYSESLKINKTIKKETRKENRKIRTCETCGKSFIFVLDGTKNCRSCRTSLGFQKKAESVEVIQPKAWDVDEDTYKEI